MFVPKQGAFSFFDYQKIEPRLLAYYLAVPPVRDTTLVDAIVAGKDLYREIVGPMLGKAPHELEEEEYQRGKVQFLSLIYGGGTRTLQEQFGISQKEARAVLKSFRTSWPSIQELQQRLLGTANSRGYIKTPWGRHLHMEPFGEHKLLNKLIQGSAAHLMKRALLKIDQHLLEHPEIASHMVSVIHDEIILDGPESELELLHEIVPALIGDEIIERVVPIGVDHEVSLSNWAEKEDYSDWLKGRKESSQHAST